MKKMLWCLIAGICCASACCAQGSWTLPKLRELTQADAIKGGAAHLSAKDVALLKQVAKGKIEGCVDNPGPSDPKTARGLFSEFRARRISLAPRGGQGLVVQGSGACMCGAVGNCPFWIIGEGSRPLVLLETEGIQTFAFQKGTSSGRFDLLLGTHSSAMQTDLQRFRFDGDKYALDGCAEVDWDDVSLQLLPKPRVTPGKCP
jgi:hypothetical protein